MKRPARFVAVFVLCLATACAGRGGSARTVESTLDDVLKLFRQTSIDDVVRGGTDDLDQVFRANSGTIDRAFRTPGFQTAVRDSAVAAEAQVTSRVSTLFDRLDSVAQKQVERKLRTMICEARLYAQNQHGDVEVLRPWISQEFNEIEVQLTLYGLDEIGRWLAEKVNDKTSLYSLACVVWMRPS